MVTIQQLPGGTAEYYEQHICESVDKLARTYSNFHHAEYQDFSRKITENISNTTTDRVAVNHAAIQRINENWDKSLYEINCHLHPLDTIASYCHAALKPLATGRGQSYVKDTKHCLADE